MNVTRPIRIARRPSSDRSASESPAATSERPPAPSERQEGTVRRENSGATQRAARLALLYIVGIALVYAGLVVFAQIGPAAGSSGTMGDLLIAGLLAAALAALGAVVALGAAPRSVEIGDDATVVIGRFGRRYRYPGRARLKTVVLQRFPAGLLSAVPLESIEIIGGSSRRSFLVDEGLFGAGAGPSGPTP